MLRAALKIAASIPSVSAKMSSGVDKGRFDIDLGEFRLPIGAQIFVAETFRDLEIFFDSGDHEQLLVLLRRLRQRVKFSRRESAGHEEVARAFRRALGKNRRFDFDEALLVEIIAGRFGDCDDAGADCAQAAAGADRNSDR